MGDDGSVNDKPEIDLGKLDQGLTPICSAEELGLGGGVTHLEKCAEWNHSELDDLFSELSYWKEQLQAFPRNTEADRRVKFLEGTLGRFQVWYRDHNLPFPASPVNPSGDQTQGPSSEPSSADEDKDRIIEVQNSLIIRQRDANRLLRANLRYKKRPSRDDLRAMADQNRFDNGKINYSKLGKVIGHDNKVAKKWCDDYEIT